MKGRAVTPVRELDRRSFLSGVGAVGLLAAGPRAAAAQPPLPAGPPYLSGLSDEAIDAIFSRAVDELRRKRAALPAWIGDDSGRWAADLEQGTLSFSGPSGETATAPVQVIGTFVADTGGWMWGWDHPSVPAPIGAHARLVREFGAAQGSRAMTERVITIEEVDAWRFAALAAHLADAAGAYRGPAGRAAVFMTFGALTISGG